MILRGPELTHLKLIKETTSTTWDRYDALKALRPDLIIIHASCLWDNTDERKEQGRFGEFLKSLAAMKHDCPHLLVYSRNFTDPHYRDSWRKEMERAAPGISNRLHPFWIKEGPQHFRIRGENNNAFVAQDLRNQVKSIVDQIGTSTP